MKKTATFLFLCLIAAGVCAQEKAQIKVEYREKYRNWTNASIDDKMLLLANREKSHYYCPTALIVDSMLSTKEGTIQFNTMVNAAFEAGQVPALMPGPRTYVIKSFPLKKMTHYAEPAGELSHYDETMDEQHWEITDSTKTILGYECISAETKYHGRHWKAWFTPEIPISDGPWKFCGLPGLILEAVADNGKYRFEATGVENTDSSFPSKMYGHEQSESKKRKDMLDLQWYFYNNAGAMSNAEYGTSSKDIPLPKGFDLIETDYH